MKECFVKWVAATVAAALLTGCGGSGRGGASGGADASRRALVVFAGAASQPATAEAARRFGDATGLRVECTFGGSGAVLNQIQLEQYGDVFIPGSDDYMDLAEERQLVDPTTRRVICFLVPVICVAPGNPLDIRTLTDLARPGMRVAIGDPASVCLGNIAKEAMEALRVYRSVRENIVTFASDCQQVASLIRLQEVDAAVGYDVFGHQSPGQLDVVPLGGEERVRVPAAVVVFSQQAAAARRFVEYVSGPQGRKVFREHGYSTEP